MRKIYSGDNPVKAEGVETTSLSKAFTANVLEQHEKYAWYVDYATDVVEARGFLVRFLSEDPFIAWSNENKEQRDPDDPASTNWESEDIARWFEVHDDYERESNPHVLTGETRKYFVRRPVPQGGHYRHILRFTTANEKIHSLTLEPFRAVIDDGTFYRNHRKGNDSESWGRYVLNGIRGALEPFLVNPPRSLLFDALLEVEIIFIPATETA